MSYNLEKNVLKRFLKITPPQLTRQNAAHENPTKKNNTYLWTQYNPNNVQKLFDNGLWKSNALRRHLLIYVHILRGKQGKKTKKKKTFDGL